MESIESIDPSDIAIFPEFILPTLHSFLTDEDAYVRATYASCIATIAESAQKVLELGYVNGGAASMSGVEGEDMVIFYRFFLHWFSSHFICLFNLLNFRRK